MSPKNVAESAGTFYRRFFNLFCALTIKPAWEQLKHIYDILQSKYQPVVKRKSVVHKPERKKNETQQQQLLLPGKLQSGLSAILGYVYFDDGQKLNTIVYFR